MTKKIVCLVAVATMLVIGAAVSQEDPEQVGNKQEVRESKPPTADRHRDRGMTCGGCHDGEAAPQTAASQKSCITCKNHDSIKTVAERTSAGNAYMFNPHRNHILETNDLECTQCHQAHKADTIVCHRCHQGMKFK